MLGSLDVLPAELLVLVLRFLDSEDLKRTLSISKTWYEYAVPIASERVALPLWRKIPRPQQKTPKSRRRHCIEDYVTHLTMLLFPLAMSDEDLINQPKTINEIVAWLCKDILPSCRRLTTINMTEAPANLEYYPYRGLPDGAIQRSTISLFQVQALMQTMNKIPSLSTVHIDMSCPRLSILEQPGIGNNADWCADLVPLMQHLDHVELRMPYVCSQIFSLYQEQFSAQATPPKGPISIVINCSMASKDPRWMNEAQSWDCKPLRALLKTPVLADTMINAARACLPYFPRIQRLRIIHHNMPLHKIIAHDIIDGENYEVPENDWTASGQMIEELSGNESEEEDLTSLSTDDEIQDTLDDPDS
ncbi:hypothetical protein FH972_024157 [Carpinus fangiana]|uniref:F-box domain-containing protein n=1 Tax=Carpinus fangiana TaxID=176857 RepID=A0A5N6KXK3_9ROSI|nr:hypothetical protein FH972_024157 [Carpinus fangiana]